MSEHERIHKALVAVKKATETCQAQWIIGGSASLMLRGLELSKEPRDLDIYCDDVDVHILYKALDPFALDQPTLSVTDMYRSTLSHFLIHEIQVELVGGFEVNARGNRYETMVNKLLMPFSEQVVLNDADYSVAIVPLAHELWFNFLRERMDRVDLIVKAFAKNPMLHEEALLAIEKKNTFTAEARRSLHHLLSNRKAGGL
ncbi:hypothetical protein [Bacillus sp. FJAT-28004]|uniref:hypothetical protein n=1 Tax=Bacillus sp. FJAT-28004 TaxID=1679165 RepID=UPI0006B5843C|nr:hypothetical protein [Bacillus sp. FJAT-28004]